ncbi:hypothetical protein LU631_11260 [Erwinia tracheiphila]|uniref:Uncharacterized protein n=1 Tax=Erwinia tracheiphila TaxID=65700 RepID=A0A0M2K9A7_9GAMM|nr:hypothetical protein [Erwinia tracheiphila]KKF34368.1 hypothetical protein SY86_23590 [Erwinia tracheiphila]KKF34456.1 hypothetical protein SY86_01655 [Erwinia tracheiphila]KKF35504.1 hypothetical protein SY86_08810 [Erwinia tracheiphila]KKF35854.1 hypothetical protein SY86_11105 [Erwinia tracheiphila]UIA86124.1 hypothetical protein LU631_13590 [Erwinia tracheiphila]
MDARNAQPLKTKPPGYIEVSIDDATDYFLPYDDQHVIFSFRQYICINGARFNPGEVVILMWKNGREVRGQYAGSCILLKAQSSACANG